MSIKIESKKQIENGLTAKHGIGLCVRIVKRCVPKEEINYVERSRLKALIAIMCGLQGKLLLQAFCSSALGSTPFIKTSREDPKQLISWPISCEAGLTNFRGVTAFDALGLASHRLSRRVCCLKVNP